MASLTEHHRRGFGTTLRSLLAIGEHGSGGSASSRIATSEDTAERNRLLEHQNRELRLAVLRLRRLVYVDDLTGLANRRHFEDALHAEIRRASRDAAPLSLVLCDVDFFKRCNDTFGHEGGDAVLRKLGEVLRGFCRRAGDVAARYGGEEFALLLPGVSTSDAIHIGECLRRSVAALTIRCKDIVHPSQVTISVGVTTFHAVTPCTPSTLVRAADAGLYRAKSAGRNRTVFQAIERAHKSVG